MQKQKGFTLVEMMIAIAILGVLAAFAIPSYQNYVEKGRLAEAKQLMISIKQEYENAKMQTPNDFDTLEKAQNKVENIRTKKANASPIKDLYNVNIVVASVGDSETVHYMLGSVIPKDSSKSSIYMTANGNVYKCPKGTLSDTSKLEEDSKPAACAEKI